MADTSAAANLLARRLASYRPGRRGQAAPAGGKARPAAVLVPVWERPDGLAILLTKRAADLREHAGQVSFPGGHIEIDDPSAEGAALREAGEEIGLAASDVVLLGRLDTYGTGSGFAIVPVVGLIAARAAFTLDPREVAELFHLPLAHLLDRRHHGERHWFERGEARRAPQLEFGTRQVWGATAGMLINLVEILEG